MPDAQPILVVDPGPAAVAAALESRGHAVVRAGTGAEGLRAAAQLPVAVAFVSATLPDMAGQDVVTAMRDRPNAPEVVVVARRAGRASALMAVEAGAAGYLVEPVPAARLDALVRSLLRRRTVAGENGRSFERADGERRRLNALYQISRRLAGARDTEEILSLLVNEATRLLDGDAAGIRLLEGGDDLVLGARSESAAALMVRDRIKVGESLSGRVVATGAPLAVADLAEDTRFDPAHKEGAVTQGFHAFVGVPLRLSGAVIGALVVFTKQRREFTEDEVSLLSAFADHAALAIHHAGLLREATEGRRLVEELYRVAVSIQDSRGREDRLRAFIQGAREAVGFDRIYVMLATADGDLELVTSLVEGEAPPPARLPLSPAAGPFFEVVQSVRALAVLSDQDLAAVRPLAPAYRTHAFFRTRRFIIAPLAVGGRVLGVAVADNKNSRRPIPPASVEPFALLCQQLATALESGRLYGESQAREREASGLYEATRRLASTLDVDTLLDGIVAQVMDLLGSDASSVLLWDAAESALTFRRGVNIDEGITRRLILRPGEGVAGRAFAERRAVWSRERMSDPALSYSEAARAMIAARPPRACLAVPIERRGEAIGVLLGLFAAPHDFTAKEVQLLSSLADQAAIAMDNAGLYHEARTQQTRLAQILDSTSDGIVLLGTDGRVETANRRAGELIGFDPDAAGGLSLDELAERYRASAPDFAAACTTLRAMVAAPDRAAAGDVQIATSGQMLHWTAQPTRTASGDTVGLTVTFHDVTHERHVSQMKSDFVSFATHQLRTPLAGIKWMLELAAQEPELPGDVASHIEDAREAAQRLIELVNDLLDVSRLEQGRLSMTPQAVPVADLTRDVLEDMAGLVRDRRHRLQVEAPGDLPAVHADRQLLRQVVLNLVSNAVKYTPPGGDIAIRMAAGDGELTWSVRDSGIGIPKPAQARLFEKFYRADNAAAVETEGTGLGLHLVRLILERMGGRIWCESEEGRGSMFAFTLPLGATAP